MRSPLITLTMMTAAFALGPVALGQGVVTDSSELPPDGVYISPHEYMHYSWPEGGLILDDPVLRPLVETTLRENIGIDELETFEAQFEAVALGVDTIAISGPVQMLTRNRALSTAGAFDAEIVSLTLWGDTPTGPIMIRESPIRASAGITVIDDIGGGLYHIDSFFDVFTELSVDGGESWIASGTSTRLYLADEAPEPDGLDSGTADLPPDGVYVGPGERHRYPSLGFVLEDPALHPDVATTQRTIIGNDEIETFIARLEAHETGQDLGPIVLAGPIEIVTRNRALSRTGSFPTEIVSMSLVGDAPFGQIAIREDPVLVSTGVTDVIDIGGGLYHIDSFFDVFTELSVDGGQSWHVSSESMRLYLVPRAAPCPEDIDGDDEVGFGDLLRVLSAWGSCGVPCPEDLDGDGDVAFGDLLRVLSTWGPCS